MSIVALKRKTATLIKNLSVGEAGFSINGTHRNQGYIGQNVTSRHTSRTLARGIAVRGSGGCCGRYDVKPSIMSGLVNYNDNTVVKKSSLGTKGQIMTQHPWIRRPAPYSSVKPDVNMNNNSQSTYIDYLSKKAIKSADDPYCNYDYGNGLLYTIYYGYYGGTPDFIDTAPEFDINPGGWTYPQTISEIATLNSFDELQANYDYNNFYSTGYDYDDTTISIVGYFYVPKGKRGTWTFTITAGQACYMWISENAVSVGTSDTALIYNDGMASGAGNYSGYIHLEEDTYYPVRILGGTNGNTNDVFALKFTPPGGVETTNGVGYFFNNGQTTFVESDYQPTTSATLSSCTKKYNGTNYFRPYTNNYNRKYSAICTTAKDLTKLGPHGIAMSQGNYLANLRKKCTVNDIFNFGRISCGVPLPGS